MAYDAYMNRQTGDWVFNGNGDFMGATGIEFDRQRIWIRAKIPRGTFTYDTAKTLGSTLYEIPRNPPTKQLQNAIAAMYTALEGIQGISIDSIDGVEEDDQIKLLVQFSKSDDPSDIETFLFELASAQPEGTETRSAD